jgi:diaminohydroxyphosphoribosylaminopyrimidine deaminase / 5-amino-6-(5-phosphoribosylamino)uracil reductase
LEQACRNLNKRFFSYHEKRRPYIILKWAQTNDGFIAHEEGGPIQISNEYSNKWVHKWRSEEAAILVGTNTVLQDNPTLTTRNWQGKNPTRIVIDATLNLNLHSKVFGTEVQTIIINRQRNEQMGNLIYYKVDENLGIVEGILNCLYENQLNSVIIEGGSKTLQYFIEAGCWDEARVITNTGLSTKKGINAPTLKNELLINSENIFNDRIEIYKQKENEFL